MYNLVGDVDNRGGHTYVWAGSIKRICLSQLYSSPKTSLKIVFWKHIYLFSYIYRGRSLKWISWLKSRCFQGWFLLDILGGICFLILLDSRGCPHSLDCGWLTLNSACIIIWPFFLTFDSSCSHFIRILMITPDLLG